MEDAYGFVRLRAELSKVTFHSNGHVYLTIKDERAAIDGTPVSAIVGDDPVEYAEEYARAYGGTQWIDKERARLIKAFDDAKKKEES